jgi:hypothetical protein
VSLYRELLLSDLEKAVDLLLYGGDSKGVHAGAMVDISTILDRARGSFWPPSSKVVEDNLQGRLSIARDLLIFRPVNIFSYKMEHDLFDALTDHNEIEARTAAMVDLLDRYEGIVEDAHQVLTTAAEQRLALVLFFITAMGLIALYETVEALFGRGYDDTGDPHIAFGRIFLILAFFFAVAFIYVVWTSPHLLAIIRRLWAGTTNLLQKLRDGALRSLARG